MMDWLQHLSDDQKALVGCAVALLACGTLMSLSYYVGRVLRRAEPIAKPVADPAEPYTVRMPEPSLRPASAAKPAPVFVTTDTTRRAA
jgi:hypothetical protein